MEKDRGDAEPGLAPPGSQMRPVNQKVGFDIETIKRTDHPGHRLIRAATKFASSCENATSTCGFSAMCPEPLPGSDQQSDNRDHGKPRHRAIRAQTEDVLVASPKFLLESCLVASVKFLLMVLSPPVGDG